MSARVPGGTEAAYRLHSQTSARAYPPTTTQLAMDYKHVYMQRYVPYMYMAVMAQSPMTPAIFPSQTPAILVRPQAVSTQTPNTPKPAGPQSRPSPAAERPTPWTQRLRGWSAPRRNYGSERTRYWAERQAKLDKLAAFRREYEAVQRERRFYTKCIVANHAAVL